MIPVWSQPTPVVGLVYVAALAHDEGELVSSLIANPPPGVPVPRLSPQNGYLFLDEGEVSRFIRWGVLPAVDGSSRMRGGAYRDDVLRDAAQDLLYEILDSYVSY